MKILIIGAGGVGSAAAAILARRSFFAGVVLADYDPGRAARAAEPFGDRFAAAPGVDASDVSAVAALVSETGATHVLNAVDPRFVMPIFNACFQAGVTYLDMAMSLSQPHPEKPYELTGVKLGDEQFAQAEAWRAAGLLALCGIGIEPGLADVFARYAEDELFSEITEAGVRDGANLTVSGYEFAPSFSIWTTIEECLNPPVIY
jgi:saccharopine dehydrogenase (NAD+, L-lysine-forming)